MASATAVKQEKVRTTVPGPRVCVWFGPGLSGSGSVYSILAEASSVAASNHSGGAVMGLDDKFDAAGDKLKGKVDEVVGKATDDDSKVMKGKLEQAKGSLKDTAADLKANLKETAGERRVDREARRNGDDAAPGVSPAE